MRNLLSVLSITSIVAFSPLALAQDTAPMPIDTKAVSTLKASSDFLASQSKVNVGWFVTYDATGQEDRIETRGWGGESLLARGKGYYAVSERDDSVKEYFYDGAQFTAKDLTDNYYATLPMTGSFDEVVAKLQSDHGLTLPVWELLSANVTQDLSEDVSWAKSLGTTRIMGQWAHHLSFSEADQDWEIWISTDEKRPVPLMMTGRYKDDTSTRYQAIFHEWDFSPRIKSSSFRFKPKSGVEKIEFSTLRNAPTAGGDFEASEEK